MERKAYLSLCQSYAVIQKGINDQPQVEAPELLVKYEGHEYYPVAYTLGFDSQGRTKHTAILRDKKANSIMDVALEKVETV